MKTYLVLTFLIVILSSTSFAQDVPMVGDEPFCTLGPSTIGGVIDINKISPLPKRADDGRGLLFAGYSSQTKTKINNAAAGRMLLGRHKVSLQWISWDYFGVANVTNRGGVYYMKGEQTGRETTDFVTVDGVINSIDAKEFKFTGKIVTQVSHIFGGKPCTREGEMTFRITGKRKYWRLQQIDNPCEAVADYVDIYFR